MTTAPLALSDDQPIAFEKMKRSSLPHRRVAKATALCGPARGVANPATRTVLLIVAERPRAKARGLGRPMCDRKVTYGGGISRVEH